MAKTIISDVLALAKGFDLVARNARRIAALPAAAGTGGPKRPEIDALDFRRREV